MSYIQTKASFEKYLARIRKDAERITWEQEPVISCPACPGDGKLTSEEHEHKVEDAVYKGTFWFYKCDKCGEEFTTTTSDTLTLASLKLVEQPNNNP